MIYVEFLSNMRRVHYISNAVKRYLKFELWIILFSGILLSTSNSVYSQTVDDNFYIADSTVWCSVVLDNTLFIGGDFHGVAPFTGKGVELSLATGVYDNTLPRVNGTIYAVIPDGSGGWFIGGNFTKVGNANRNNLAHIKSDKTVDDVWNPDANSTVYSLAISGDTVYAGGSFWSLNAGSIVRVFLAAFDATSGAVTNWNPNPNGYVYAIAVFGNKVYIGGAFTTVGYTIVTRNGLAAINNKNGLTTNWDPNINSTVLSLALSGSSIYAGGTFTSVNGSTPRNRLVSFDTLSATATDWNPDVNDTVRTIVVDGDVFIGGAFTSVNGSTTRNRLAAIDKSTGIATDWDPNANKTVYSLAISGSDIYAAGAFTSVNGSTTRNRLAAIDITSGTATSWNPNINNIIYSFAISGSVAYIGGIFTSVNGFITRNHLAAFDANTGVLKNWDPNINGPSSTTVHAVALAGNNKTIFIGGIFDSVNGDKPRNNLAAFDLDNGIAKDWNPDVNGEVRTLLISEDKIYVGGDFTTINNGTISRTGIAAFDTINGTAINWDAGLNSVVRAMTVANNNLYIGGDFTLVNGSVLRKATAAFNLSTAEVTNWNPNLDNLNPGQKTIVRAVKILGNIIFIGGEFTQANGSVTRNNLASFDTSNGTVTSWDPNPNSLVRTLAVAGGTVYVGGNFTNISGTSRSRVAAFDAESGTLTDWNPNAQNTVYTMCTTDSKVYVGGLYTNILSSEHKYFAALDDPYRTTLPNTPDVPVATTATYISETSFYANWNTSSGASGYYLDVATDEAFTSIVTGYDNKDVGNVTTYLVNTNITNNTPYYYRVRAYNIGGTSTNSNTINLTTGSVITPLKVFLQGCYVLGSGAMTTALNTNGYIPLAQPYNTAPWNYGGSESVGSIPAGVVDWILVELRTGTAAATKVAERAGFLKSDGSIVNINGTSSLTFDGINAGNYYIVVRHRNHLAIMSAEAIALDAVSTLYDFTTAQSQAYGTNPMKDLGSGIFGLIAGDANGDGFINGTDFNIYNPRLVAIASGYEQSDFNLSGHVDGSDFNLYNPNLTLILSTYVP